MSIVLLLSLIVLPKDGWAKKRYIVDGYQVELNLRTDGSVQVREKISFLFQEGEFSYAYRKIKGSSIDSISDMRITSEDAAVLSVERKGGSSFRWNFEPREEPATFLLEYVAHGVLISEGPNNELNWWAVGQEWDVPVTNVSVTVTLPYTDLTQDSLMLKSDPDQISFAGANPEISFSQSRVAPEKGYRIGIAFPERLKVIEDHTLRNTILWALGLGFLGLIGAIFGWERPPKVEVKPRSTDQQPELSLGQAGHLYHVEDMGRSRLFNGMIFSLAQRGHLKLRTEEAEKWYLEDQAFAEEIDLDGDLTEQEYRLLRELKKQPNLKKFGEKAHKFRSEELKELRQELVKAGSYRSLREKMQTWLPTGGILIVAGLVSLWLIPQPWTGPLAGLQIGVGLAGLIVGSQRYVLTEKGTRQRSEVKSYATNLRREIDGLRNTGQSGEAVRKLLKHLPWLSLDEKVNEQWLKKLQKTLKDSDEQIVLPDWLVDPTGELTINDAFAAFTPMMIVFTQSSAAAGAAGAGAAGGGAGGGGGAG